MIYEHAEIFASLPVDEWSAGDPLIDPRARAFRLTVDAYEPEQRWTALLQAFVETPGAREATALVVGTWGEVATGDGSDTVVRALVDARSRLPGLRALFLGDIIGEESEISWIKQSNLAPLFTAYPALETFRVRGGQGLALGVMNLRSLRHLTVETGGLDRSVLDELSRSTLPELTHLELWLGDDDYGANTSPADLGFILEGARFPKLQTLALRNCHYADDLAKAVAGAPVLERVNTLDLSLGNLSDEGARALVASPRVKRLTKLDLHHHYLSDAMQKSVRALGVDCNLEDVMEADVDDDETHRYIAVAE